MALDGVIGGSSSLVTVEVKGLDKMMKTFDPKRFRQFFNKHMNLGLRRYAYQMMRRIMTTIHNGNFAKLGIQRYIKGSDKVLVDSGNLMAHAIGWKFIKADGGTTLGIRFGPREGVHGPSGLTYEKLITLLSEGTSFTPTLAQRVALKTKLKEGKDQSYDAPKPPPKPVWTIPPRPFLANALNKPVVRTDFRRTVKEALANTIRDLQK